MRVVLAGGGTAGHISPMLATADALRETGEVDQITCVGTPVGLEVSVVPEAGYSLQFVDPVPLPRRPSLDLLTLPGRILASVRQATKILRTHRADVVAGFGGYASLPVVLAARRLAIPVVIHEANAVPGLTNRIARRFATHVCVTFSSTGWASQQVTGMPIRPQIATLDREAERPSARVRLGLDPSGPVVLVSGGSQGAKRLNDAIMAALPRLREAGISVLHVTGPANFDRHDGLEGLESPQYVRLAYVDHMEDAYAAADLMVARSGAATVSETAVVGLPAIFVPLPHGNGEQAKNAADVLRAGAGILVEDAELTSDRLADDVIALLKDPPRLTAMGEAASRLMPRDAATRVARLILAAATNRQEHR